MNKIGFVGTYDKTDLMLYIAKILITLGRKVLVIDSTVNQKAKYVVPVVNPTKTYLTEYEGIDVAVGFNSFEEIKQYLGIPHTEHLDYDYAFIDVDSSDKLLKFNLYDSQKNYFVTSFDVYHLKKGLEILSGLTQPIQFKKIFYSKEVSIEEDAYFDFLALGHKAQWEEDKVYFPIENGDLSIISENQRVSKIKLKKLSVQFKENLIYLAEEILQNVSSSELRKAVKIIERGV